MADAIRHGAPFRYDFGPMSRSECPADRDAAGRMHAGDSRIVPMLGADRPRPMSKCSVWGRSGLVGKEREIVGATAVTVYKCHGARGLHATIRETPANSLLEGSDRRGIRSMQQRSCVRAAGRRNRCYAAAKRLSRDTERVAFGLPSVVGGQSL